MRHLVTVFLLAVALAPTAFAQPATAAAASAAASAPARLFKPGLWETTVATENAATSTRRSTAGRTCVQPDEATAIQRIIPVQHEREMQCENRDVKRDGPGWVWAISCKSADGVQTGSGKMMLSNDSYLGRAEVELRKKGAKAVKVGQTFSGKWIQACS